MTATADASNSADLFASRRHKIEYLIFSMIISAAAAYGASFILASPVRHSANNAEIAATTMTADGHFRFSDRPGYAGYSPTTSLASDGLPSCAPWPSSQKSLTLGAATLDHCQVDPADESIGLYISPANGASAYSEDLGFYSGDVRAAHIDQGSRVIVAGPVLMTVGFNHDGGSWPVYARYGNSLWIYANSTPSGPVLLRISASTGAVLQHVAVRDISAPNVAANAAGFWIGSFDRKQPIFFVAVGATRAIAAYPKLAEVEQFQGSGDTMNAYVSFVSNPGRTAVVDSNTQTWRFVRVP